MNVQKIIICPGSPDSCQKARNTDVVCMQAKVADTTVKLLHSDVLRGASSFPICSGNSIRG